MAIWTFFTTNECYNECIICCSGAQPNCGYYPVGRSDTEKSGLSALLRALNDDGICLSGGDPLRNYQVLELVSRLPKKTIVINPISFLTLQSGKRAGSMTASEARDIRLNVEKKGFNPTVQRMLPLLARFDTIGYSCGNLQAPNPEIMTEANALFMNQVLPHLNKKVALTHQIADGDVSSGVITSVNCASYVGMLRQAAENGRFPGIRLEPCQSIEVKTYQCDKNHSFYFKRDSQGTSLYLTACCNPGLTPYTALRTKLTLEDMAQMQPESLRRDLLYERKRMKESAWQTLLCGDSDDQVSINFLRYMDSANRLLKMRATKQADVYQLQILGSDMAGPCEMCYNASLQLHLVGISPKEWHEFLEKDCPPNTQGISPKEWQNFLKTQDCESVLNPQQWHEYLERI